MTPPASGGSRPVRRANAVAPTSLEEAVVASAAQAAGQQRRVLARMVGARRRRIDAVVGAPDGDVARRERAEQAGHGLVDLAQPAAKPATSLRCPQVWSKSTRLAKSRPCDIVSRWRRQAARPAVLFGRVVVDVDPALREDLADLADADHRHALRRAADRDRSDRSAAARSRGAAACARRRPPARRTAARSRGPRRAAR